MKQKLSHLSNTLARKGLRLNSYWASKHWRTHPFGNSVRASHDTYMTLWEEERSRAYPEIDSYEQETGYTIEKDWLDKLALHTQIVVKNSPLCYQHGRILYAALSDYLNKKTEPSKKNITIYETGTARGFSSVVMASALAKRNACGKILTFDVLPHNIPMYWNCIDDCERQKSRAEILKPWRELVENYVLFFEGDSFINLQAVQTERVHFAFLDGAHSYRDVAFEFKTVAARQKQGDVIIFDDYNSKQFPGLVRALDEGCDALGYDKRILRTGSDRAYVITTKQGA